MRRSLPKAGVTAATMGAFAGSVVAIPAFVPQLLQGGAKQ
jgi:hypothetical protein